MTEASPTDLCATNSALGDSEEVAELLRAVPEFSDRYLELVEDADDHPGAQATFAELADYVEGLAFGLESLRPILLRCLEAVEHVASTSEDAEELVGWSFLDELSIEARSALLSYLGTQTLAILESVEDPDGDD
jgi:hypothetical protein